jgi:hypothetical protein
MTKTHFAILQLNMKVGGTRTLAQARALLASLEAEGFRNLRIVVIVD